MHLQFAAAQLVALLLATSRIFAWSMIAPPLATGGIPKAIRVPVSAAIALAVLPTAQQHVPGLETAAVLSALVLQVAIGMGLGFLTRMLFTAVESAGSLLDVFGGFSLAMAYDPLTTTTSSIFGRFYGLLCTTLLMVTDAHLYVFQGFLNSFTAIPLDAGMSLHRLGAALTSGVSELFISALQIAGPLVIVYFIADLALGVLSRIAPQLNAFSLSFPIKIGLTFLLVGLTFVTMPNLVANLAQRAASITGLVAP
jgi:flagellar biosynthetic protein FliR